MHTYLHTYRYEYLLICTLAFTINTTTEKNASDCRYVWKCATMSNNDFSYKSIHIFTAVIARWVSESFNVCTLVHGIVYIMITVKNKILKKELSPLFPLALMIFIKTLSLKDQCLLSVGEFNRCLWSLHDEFRECRRKSFVVAEVIDSVHVTLHDRRLTHRGIERENNCVCNTGTSIYSMFHEFFFGSHTIFESLGRKSNIEERRKTHLWHLYRWCMGV